MERKTNTYRRSWRRQWDKGSHVAKLILYTSLSLLCISNRNQRCLQQNIFFHNGFNDYFRFCSKRRTFIQEQRSDRNTQRLHCSFMARILWHIVQCPRGKTPIGSKSFFLPFASVGPEIHNSKHSFSVLRHFLKSFCYYYFFKRHF